MPPLISLLPTLSVNRSISLVFGNDPVEVEQTYRAYSILIPTMSTSEKSVSEASGKVQVIDWDSDGRNPYNWPMWKRVYHAVLAAVFGLVVYVSYESPCNTTSMATSCLY